VGVEGSHEDQRDVDSAGGIEVLDLAYGKVKEGHIVLHLEGALGSGHTCEGR